MSDDIPPAPAKPRRAFRSASTPRLAPDQARRQGQVARDAWAQLGTRERVMAFLNERHDALDGRPLDLAIESDAGLERVRQLLLTLAPATA